MFALTLTLRSSSPVHSSAGQPIGAQPYQLLPVLHAPFGHKCAVRDLLFTLVTNDLFIHVMWPP